MNRKLLGYSLIEAMVTVAIVAILAGIAYPSFQQQVSRSRRTDATGSLMEVAQVLERCFTSYGAYNDNNCSVVSVGAVARDSREGYYDIVSTNLTATTFTLRATAKAGASQASDGECATLFLANTGRREAKASDGSDATESCWVD